MQTHELAQGSPEWHAHRAAHFNASDAPAMLGCCPFQTRTQLLHRLFTGVTPEVDAATQRRFDDGHRFERLCRPLAAKIIGESLYPVTGSEGRLSASFDGLTMDESTAFEHKGLNKDLAALIVGDFAAVHLPKHYRVQMEQQLMVSGAQRVLFMASQWDGADLVDSRHCWYESDVRLRAEIMAGWAQLAEDLAAYVPPAPVALAPVANPVEALPSVTVTVTGEITLRENFAAFEVALTDFLEHRLIRKPTTDQDFADLDLQIKAMKGAESALINAEGQMLAQILSIDNAIRRKDTLLKLVRDNRLLAEKLLTSEKERRRGEIVAGGIAALRDHIAALNTRLGKPFMPQVPADFGGVIKGKRNLEAMEDAVASELARAKIAANEIADRIQVNMTAIAEAGQPGLFADIAALVLKAPEDCAAQIAHRLAAEQKRMEDQRAKIQAEEEAKARARVAQEAAAAAEAEKPAPTPAPAPVAAPAVVSQAPAPRPAAPPADTGVRIRLGQVNERIAPFASLTAENLRALGFEPVATDKAAKLYRESDYPRMVRALIERLEASLEPATA